MIDRQSKRLIERQSERLIDRQIKRLIERQRRGGLINGCRREGRTCDKCEAE